MPSWDDKPNIAYFSVLNYEFVLSEIHPMLAGTKAAKDKIAGAGKRPSGRPKGKDKSKGK